ncbi:DNA-directed RNA polymerase subunit E'' [Candidatus Woesearchaeota archaeon CG11_big_fil_rev_8_21_14_0_20_57_5]|nr:MAG: DNA-directed RNA polymerase subunit E'' [Candidatus Woesearchaeota archaeon CG11_big_fil_rev_8_21_14_0_20_57_5]
MARFVNKKTKMFVDKEKVDTNTSEYSSNWQGRVFVVDPDKSRIAKEMGFEKRGEFAIKVR